MEFHEKLQLLRKEKHLTQEQLAEQLYVSRTAVSKWESGRGYPNLESLKTIAKLFGVSVDELLSGEEMIVLAETENRANVGRISVMVSGMLDIISGLCLFLPLYGQHVGGVIHAVTLADYQEITPLLRICYFSFLIGIFLLGILKILTEIANKSKGGRICQVFSDVLHTAAILLFALSRQPYVTALLFVFFLVKIVLILQRNRIK